MKIKRINKGIKGQSYRVLFGGGARMFIIYVPSSKVQVNRKCGGVAIFVLHLCSLGIQTTNTPRVNTVVCFDLPDFKEGGEASSHPRHSDNKLHGGRASGIPSEGKLEEREQTCHSDCPVIASPGFYKELAAEALSLHFLSTRGHDGNFVFITYQAMQDYISCPPPSIQTGKPLVITLN